MNTRVLDIIKNTEILQAEDLKLLESEIEKYPYMQSLRAINLLGIHQYYPENFQKELTKTAAYTTDKRILYHLINVKKVNKDKETKQEESQSLRKVPEIEVKEETLITTPKEKEKKIVYGIDFYTKNMPSQPEPKEEIVSKPVVNYPKPVYTTSIMDFYTSPRKVEEPKEEAQKEIDFYQKSIDISENMMEEEKEEKYEWKPMQLEKPITIAKIEEKEEIIPEEEKEEVREEIIVPVQKQSNVSAFINTWQNWLKIDRTNIPKLSEQEKKATIIDKFIENNPKISPIKEEVDFMVKEKSDDISHLMTETLAQLYLEQKLYTKAINAYKILQEKYPEKEEEFEQKIEEIKQIRGGR